MIASSVTIQPTLVLKLSKQTCANNLIRKTIKFSLPPHFFPPARTHRDKSMSRLYLSKSRRRGDSSASRILDQNHSNVSLHSFPLYLSTTTILHLEIPLYGFLLYTYFFYLLGSKEFLDRPCAREGWPISLEISRRMIELSNDGPKISPYFSFSAGDEKHEAGRSKKDGRRARSEARRLRSVPSWAGEEEEGESNFRRQLIGHSRSVILNRLIEFLPIFFLSAPFIDASRRPIFSFHAPSTFSFPSHRSPLSSVSDLSHVPLRDQFVNRICELVVSHPPSFLSPRILHSSSRRWRRGGCLATPFDLSSIR